MEDNLNKTKNKNKMKENNDNLNKIEDDLKKKWKTTSKNKIEDEPINQNKPNWL